MVKNTILVRKLGIQSCKSILKAMQYYTNHRNISSYDQLWLVEHYPIFTKGQTLKDKYIELPSNIPVMQSDRGGNITYHGPGQQIMYVLIDIKRRKISVRKLVVFLEKTVINVLSYFKVEAHTCINAPGVYVNDKKICSLGLRIRNGYSFHGLALNVSMDLSPFSLIDPCGYPGMRMTQLQDFQSNIRIEDVQFQLVRSFSHLLNYNNLNWINSFI